MTWGGAQWLVIFFVFTRALLGAAVVTNKVRLPVKETTPLERYRNSRIGDAVAMLILIWGGFFS